MENKYPSKFSPGKLISADKFLAEIICDRHARSKGITLPSKFWNTLPIWEKEFLKQLRSAKNLLNIYSIEAIFSALKTKKGKNIYSFNATWLDDLIKMEQHKINLLKINKPEPEPIKEDIIDAPLNRPEFKKNKNIKDKLDEI